MTNTTLDPELVGPLALKVWQYKQGEVVALMIHLGDRLGLYRAMDGAGPLDADGLAERTGLQRRWLLEWLRGQAAAGLIESTDGRTFELTPEQAAVLSDEAGSLWFAAGAFHGGVVTPEVRDRLGDAFQTGVGLSYNDLGPDAAHGVERMLAPWSRLALVPRILPAIDGVTGRLTAGARVADVGCGAGVALLAMAQAFPQSGFVGYDPSSHAISLGRERAVRAGIENVEFRCEAAVALPDRPTYDLVVTLDCIHDMAHPAQAITAIRRAIADDGVWLIKDIKSSGSWAQDQRNPVLAMMYGTSVAHCMSSALSEPGGAGLGTLGFDPHTAEAMCRQAGFSSFQVHDFDDPANLYYEVRP